RVAVEDRLIDMIRQKARETGEDQEPLDISREELARRLAAGELEANKVEIVVETRATPVMVGGIGMEHLDIDLQGMFDKIMPKQTNRRELTVAQARKILFEQECEARLDTDKINANGIELAENLGIIFIDELDKIVASDSRGADVSRQGVQRDLLPIVEGTHVQTRYGHVRTEHILFIAAGRLYTILERLLEDLSFEAPDMHTGHVQITAEYVKQRLSEVAADEDLSRYIL